MARTNTLNSKSNRGKTALTVLFAAVALFYLMPIILVLINSFKDNAHVTPRPSPCRTANPLSALQTTKRA